MSTVRSTHQRSRITIWPRSINYQISKRHDQRTSTTNLYDTPPETTWWCGGPQTDNKVYPCDWPERIKSEREEEENHHSLTFITFIVLFIVAFHYFSTVRIMFVVASHYFLNFTHYVHCCLSLLPQLYALCSLLPAITSSTLRIMFVVACHYFLNFTHYVRCCLPLLPQLYALCSLLPIITSSI